MKKQHSILVALILALVVCSFTACSEGAPKKSGAVGTAIALGHGSCVTEVTVVVNGYGEPVKVQFDDIFPASNVYTNMALKKEGDTTEVVQVGTSSYFKYLRIGQKYFKADENGKYYEMGSASGKITDDLMTYYKTAEGTRWYYDSFLSGNLWICAESESGTEIDGVKLADKYKFNTSNGSMRKRYSRYWSTLGSGSIGQVSGLGFNGNMDMLENYLLAHGFDALASDDAIVLPKDSGTGYNVIGGVTTGATLSADTAIYLKTAKAAYENALAAQK